MLCDLSATANALLMLVARKSSPAFGHLCSERWTYKVFISRLWDVLLFAYLLDLNIWEHA